MIETESKSKKYQVRELNPPIERAIGLAC
jgi:hypothetical protein